MKNLVSRKIVPNFAVSKGKDSGPDDPKDKNGDLV